MRRRSTICVSIVLSAMLIFIASGAGVRSADVELTEAELKRIFTHWPLPDPPVDETNAVADDPAAARLGQFLFFDERLSANGEVACAACHDPARGFGDGEQLAEAIGVLDRHTPPLFNVAHNRWLFWDGRADTLWAQALIPLEVPSEHGFSRLQLAHLLHDDQELSEAYETIFGSLPNLSDEGRYPPAGRPVVDDEAHPHHVAYMSMTEADRDAVDRIFANVGKAIGAYERRLISRDAPFDLFVESLKSNDGRKRAALSTEAQRGLRLFIGKANCRLCHTGPNFTDGEFHSTGVPPLGGGRLRDSGRYKGASDVKESAFNAAGPFSDDREGARAQQVRTLINSSEQWGQFKTPSLRNVALTAPYMHQGQFATLDDVLLHYSTLEDAVLPGHHQEQLLVPLNLTTEEIADLKAFLRSLTGAALDESLLRKPESPVLHGEGGSSGE